MVWTLSIDFGTSNTAAAVSRNGGAVTPVRLTSNSDLMPSAVVTLPEGGFLTSVAAVRSTAVYADAFVASPKRLLGHDPVLLGGRDVASGVLVAAVLKAAADKATKHEQGIAPDRVILTHPQGWGRPRQLALLDAWQGTGCAGAAEVVLASEPISAARALAADAHLPDAATIAVLDYGGGTCDVAVLRRDAAEAPWDVLAHDGNDRGGADIDVLLLDWARAQLRALGHSDLDAALDEPVNLGALRTLMQKVCEAKEDLSEAEQAQVPVSIGGKELVLNLTRPEFDTLIHTEIAEVRRLTEHTLRRAGLTPTNLDVLFLTGGSSHLRAVHRTVEELLGGRPAGTLNDPKTVVAIGAHLVAADQAIEPARAANHDDPAPADERTAAEVGGEIEDREALAPSDGGGGADSQPLDLMTLIEAPTSWFRYGLLDEGHEMFAGPSTENVVITREPNLAGADAQALADLKGIELRALRRFQELAVVPVTALGGYPAVMQEYTYRTPGGVNWQALTLNAVVGTSAIVATASARKRHFARHRSMFHDILRIRPPAAAHPERQTGEPDAADTANHPAGGPDGAVRASSVQPQRLPCTPSRGVSGQHDARFESSRGSDGGREQDPVHPSRFRSDDRGSALRLSADGAGIDRHSTPHGRSVRRWATQSAPPAKTGRNGSSLRRHGSKQSRRTPRSERTSRGWAAANRRLSGFSHQGQLGCPRGHGRTQGAALTS